MDNGPFPDDKHDGLCWFMLIYVDLLWFIVIYDDKHDENDLFKMVIFQFATPGDWTGLYGRPLQRDQRASEKILHIFT